MSPRSERKEYEVLVESDAYSLGKAIEHLASQGWTVHTYQVAFRPSYEQDRGVYVQEPFFTALLERSAG